MVRRCSIWIARGIDIKPSCSYWSMYWRKQLWDRSAGTARCNRTPPRPQRAGGPGCPTHLPRRIRKSIAGASYIACSCACSQLQLRAHAGARAFAKPAAARTRQRRGTRRIMATGSGPASKNESFRRPGSLWHQQSDNTEPQIAGTRPGLFRDF